MAQQQFAQSIVPNNKTLIAQHHKSNLQYSLYHFGGTGRESSKSKGIPYIYLFQIVNFSSACLHVYISQYDK
jgi:hypothetical protein